MNYGDKDSEMQIVIVLLSVEMLYLCSPEELKIINCKS
jgi:hypothetical protein